MRLPKRGEKGFTLIELLIVVAILGVLAAVVIPNVGQFIGAGTEEARETEFTNIQTAVHSMMVDNEIDTLPHPVTDADPVTAGNQGTNDMSKFPDVISNWTGTEVTTTDGGKWTDPDGDAYEAGDDPGYLLQDHDKTGGGAAGPPVDYVAMSTSTYYYTCEKDGTVRQWETADATATGHEYTY